MEIVERIDIFTIEADSLCWINGASDDANDLCLHGHAVATVGGEVFEYDATVSATALYLLKTLTEDHIAGESNQMLPCCGFSLYANSAMDTVSIIGCFNGIDWSVMHEGDGVRLITKTGEETIVPLPDYRKQVYAFADKVEAFYQACSPKKLPEDELDKAGYIAFWNEWLRRRNRKNIIYRT